MVRIANALTVTGHVIETRRTGTSTMGNPSFDVSIRLASIDGTPVEATNDTLRTVTIRTATNAGIAYGITNSEYRETEHAFKLNKSGHIVSAKRVTA